MKKTKELYIFVAVLCAAVAAVLTGCQPKQEVTLTVDKSIIESDPHYILYGNEEERSYYYEIIGSNEKVVDSGSVEGKAPSISYTSDDVIEVRFHGGTYADLCRYYSISRNELSSNFWNPYMVIESLIIFYDADRSELIVQNIFDTDDFYKSFSRDIIFTGPPEEIEMSEDGKSLFITYMRKDSYELVSENLDLS